MKPDPEYDSPQKMRWDEKDAVWRLLGRAPRQEPDAWFAARTLARCRNEKLSMESAGMVSLASVWRWVMGGGVAICMALALAIVPQMHPKATPKTDDQKGVQEAFQIIASIDNPDTDSSSSSSTWQDSSL